MFIRRIIHGLILLVWAGCMGWLVRFEAYPHLFDNSMMGYKDAFRNMPQLMDSWMRVLADGEHVGYSYSSVDREENERFTGTRLQSLFYLKLEMAGEIENFRMTSTVRLDERKQLREFEFTALLATMNVSVKGLRLEGTDYEVELNMGGQELRKGRMTIPQNALLYLPTMESAFRRLEKGDSMRIRMLDPLTAGKHDLVLRGLGDEAITLHNGEGPLPVRHVEMEMKEMVLNAWIDERGRVLRQETPLPGLVLEQASSADAISVETIASLKLSKLVEGLQGPSILNLFTSR